jgi:hypothetical protein
MNLVRSILLLGVLSTVACGGNTSSDIGAGPTPGGDETQDELNVSSSLVKDAIAVELTIKPMSGGSIEQTVALPAKVKKVLKGIKKRSENNSPPRCRPSYTAKAKFFGKDGKEVASLTDLLCGTANLKVGDAEEVFVSVTADLKEIAEEALVPADALWAIDKVEVNKVREQDKKTVTDADEVKKLVDAIKGDQEIDGNRPMPRCLPSYSAGFKRDGKEVASVNFSCAPGTTETSLFGSFEIAGKNANSESLANGAVKVNPQPFIKVFE